MGNDARKELEVLNMANSHNRMFITSLVVFVLIAIGSFGTLFAGKTSENFTREGIIFWLVSVTILMICMGVIKKFFGKKEWSKWAIITIFFTCLSLCRFVASDVRETFSLYYIVIIFSIFYFDIKLILWH